jgi:hypothetical protein|tara:strand:- start:456 stop:1091 length:636 start_codon:yes stop_codon:yes gene_type:complete
MEQTDIWSISPSTSATFFKTAATVTGGTFPRALTLTNTDPVVAKEGAGYKVIITSGGNDSGITFTINGAVVGELNNKVPAASTPEVLTGGNVTSVTSAYFYSRIDSITISAAAAGTVAVGTTGDLALPRVRIKGFYLVGGAGAGSLKTNIWSFATGSAVDQGNILDITTPAGATLTQFLSLPGQGILTGRQQNDYAVVTAAVLTDYTLFCG